MAKKKSQHPAAVQAEQHYDRQGVAGYNDRTLLLNPNKQSRGGHSTDAPAAPAAKVKSREKTPGWFAKHSAWIVYGLGFLLLAVFCTWVYGPVFHHIALDNFVCSDAEAMTYVRRMPHGGLYWAARYVLLVFKNQWLGGLLMAAVLTCAAWFFDRLFLLAASRSHRFSGFGMGLGFLPVVGLLWYMVHRGYNLFLRCEISTFVIWTLGLSAVAIVVGLVALLLCRFVFKRPSAPTTGWAYVGCVLTIAAFTYVVRQAYTEGENVRVSCRMQNILDETEDWDTMADLARSCKQPSRSVAAYYIIALVHQNELLEHVFDIPYDYPELQLDNVGGDDEGLNYIADCNLHAGLVTGAYHTSMENHVMYGPHLRNYKRMAVCAILNGEFPLAKRYLRLISKVPFEKEWVEKYEAMIADPKLIDEEEAFGIIKKLAPQEQSFEQKYRMPLFLGYNAGVLNGSNETLVTSVATCMYSKDLNSLLPRIEALSQRTTLPLPVMQALMVASINRPGLLDQYPQVKQQRALLDDDFGRFIQDVKPYLDKKKKVAGDEAASKAIQKEMSDSLRERWLTTYYYYYYCGNLNQTVKKAEGHGVN